MQNENPKPSVAVYKNEKGIFIVPGEWAKDGGTLVGSKVFDYTSDTTDERLGQAVQEALDTSKQSVSEQTVEEVRSSPPNEALLSVSGYADWATFASSPQCASVSLRKGTTFVNFARYDGPPRHSFSFDPNPLPLQNPSAEEVGQEVRKALDKHEAGIKDSNPR